MARKDAGQSRAGKAVRPHVTLSHDRSYRPDEFESLRNKERQYRVKATGQVISRRQYDSATHNWASNEFRVLRRRPMPEGIHYLQALHAYTETHAAEYGDPDQEQSIDRAERSPEWKQLWRTLAGKTHVGPHGEALFLDEERHYKSLKYREQRAKALEEIFGPHPTEGDRNLWDLYMSPENVGYEQAA